MTYGLYDNDSCTGTPASSDTETLNSDGTVPQSVTTAALPAGGYSYEAVYSGDSNYTTSTASCESFTVAVGTTSTATTVYDATSQSPWGSAGNLAVLAGTGSAGSGPPAPGPAVDANLSAPATTAVDSQGNLYIADTDHNVIEKVDTSGQMSVIAGTGSASCGFPPTPGTATEANLCYPTGVAVDAAGNVYIADTDNQVIEKVTPAGFLTIVAGSGFSNNAGCTGAPTSPGPATQVNLCYPSDVAVDAAGNVYIVDTDNLVIDKVTPDGNLTVLAGTGYSTDEGCTGVPPSSGPATQANLCYPVGVAVDAVGNVYIADTSDDAIEKVDPSGNLTILAGGGINGCGSVSSGPAIGASLCYPQGVAVDSAGNVYIADTLNNLIEKVDPSGNLTIIAGGGSVGDNSCNRDGVNSSHGASSPGSDTQSSGPATDVALCRPAGVATDAAGNVYIADQGNNLIEEVSEVAGPTAGASANDSSVVTPSGSLTATGTVAYSLYANDSCTGTPTATDTENLNDDGTVPNSVSSAALDAGSYSYEATYSGDSNYDGSTAGCEPFTVAVGTSTIATTTWTTGLYAGSRAFASSVVTQSGSITAAGTVAYSFYANDSCTDTPTTTSTVTLNDDGTVPDSTRTGPLAAGSYSYEAVYSGDSNYAGSSATCEPFTIGQAPNGTIR